MLRRQTLRCAGALFLVFLVGCSSVPRLPRVEQRGGGQAVVHIPREAPLQLVVVDKEEFRQALRRLAREVRLSGSPRQTVERMFRMDPQFGTFQWNGRKLVPDGSDELQDGALTQADRELAERYRQWCRDVHGFYGDCLGGALVSGRYLDTHGRYIWALAMSKSPVLDEMKQALGEMVEVRALINTVLWTLGSMLLILAVNPVAPGLVAVVGLGLVLYVGLDTLHNLVAGWVELTDVAAVATTFEQLREAGERFGKILGREAARAFAMLLMAAIGSTAQQFAAKVPTLPGSAQVALQAEGAAGIPLSSLGAVEELALSSEGVSVTVAATAMTMGASGTGSTGPCIETHHIATICNDTSSARGGPWTPRFRPIFAKAGMSLEDPANKMPLPGHYGPHPERYHRIVLDTLYNATARCPTVVVCQAKLKAALQELAKQIATPGTELNQLVTRSPPR